MKPRQSQNIKYKTTMKVSVCFCALFFATLYSSCFLTESPTTTSTNVILLPVQEAMARQIVANDDILQDENYELSIVQVSSSEETGIAIQSPISFSGSLQYNNTDLGFGLQYPSDAQVEEAGESVFFRLPDGLVSVFVDRNMEQQQLREYTNSILELLRQSYNGFSLEKIGNYTLPAGYPSDYVMFSFNDGNDDGLAFTTITTPMDDDNGNDNVGYILLFTTPVVNSGSFQDNIVDPIVSSFEINQQPSPPPTSGADDTLDEDEEDAEEDNEPVIRF